MSEEPPAKTGLSRSAPGPLTKQARRSRSSGIGVPIARSRFLMIAVAVFVGLGLAWWAATGLEWVKPIFLPSPGSVATQIAKLATDGTLWLDLKASMYRISIGFLIASALSIPIGVLIGSFRSWEAGIEPLVDFIRYMPVVAFVPLSILWAGTGDTQKFLIIFIGTFFQQVLMIMDNVKRVPTDFIGLGRTLGLPDRKILTRIVVPSALPGIWDTLRISLGWAWTWLVLAELVAATSGLGYRITVSQRYFQTNTIIGYILLLGVLGLITDQVMKALEKVLFRQDGHSQ
jgi:NitT/TauT family transport system permease protein